MLYGFGHGLDDWIDPLEQALREGVHSRLRELLKLKMTPPWSDCGMANREGAKGHRNGRLMRALVSTSSRLKVAVSSAQMIESDGTRRKVWRKGAASSFPSDQAAAELIWLALSQITESWKSPPVTWHSVKAQPSIQFGECFTLTDWLYQPAYTQYFRHSRRRIVRCFWCRYSYETRTMNDEASYTLPKVWTWNVQSGNKFANINRPVAGPTHDKELPVGKQPLQLYSLATPNGVKVTVMLEELLALGCGSAEYDAWPIRIMEGEQFSSGFVQANPNSKIPVLVDHSTLSPIRIFESGSILLYLAEKFGALLPANPQDRVEALNWLFWQVGSAPYLGGGFGQFYAYAPVKIKYAIDQFTMEVKRQLDVLDRRLAQTKYLAGDQYSIADIATWPWYGLLVEGHLFGAGEFLQVQGYVHVQRWAKEIGGRPAVQRGCRVNRTWGEPQEQLPERHDESDFERRTEGALKPSD